MLSRRLASSLLLLSLVACRTTGPAKVPESDAGTFMLKLRTIALADPEQRMRLLALACAELPSCSGSCASAFSAFGNEPDDRRGEAMLGCPAFDKYSKGSDINQLREVSKDWVHIELRSYALRIEQDEKRAAQRVLETLDRAIAGQPPYWED